MAKKKTTLKSNFRRPTLKAALRYIKSKREAEKEGTLSKEEELRLIESYRVVAEAYENTGKDADKFKAKKKSAKLSKRPSRGNFIGESVEKAKRYLKRALKYPRQKQQQPHIAARIAEAQHILKKAEERNEKRRKRRAVKQAVKRKEKQVEKSLSITKWEEVTGPNGEIVRFKIEPWKSGKLKGGFRRRVRSRQEPQPGDLVLDITGPTDDNGLGVRAWRITENRRRKHEVTDKMVANYKKSILYQVRRMAAGQISLKQLHKFIGEQLKKPSSAEYQVGWKSAVGGKRSMRRRKRKHS